MGAGEKPTEQEQQIGYQMGNPDSKNHHFK